jgi:hypothetical protein
MRDLKGSLTKELTLAVIEHTIALARHGMRYDAFRTAAARTTHADAPGLVTMRFLSVVDGRIVRDHFLSLVENESLGTPRMRKVMYGIWVLRDSRFRRFVLERIAAQDGRWRTSEVTRKSNAAFFETLGFQKNTAPKIRSNIEYFFVETGIFNAATRTVHLDLDDHWLDDAVRAAAELEDDTVKRLAMITDPVGWIVRQQFHGIANIASDALQSVPSAIPAETEPMLDAELPSRAVGVAQGRRWQQRTSNFAPQPNQLVPLNPVARERASRAHYEMERMLAGLVEAQGRQAQCNDNIDLFFSRDDGSVIVEIKSCHYGNFHAQVRRGLAQLLEYAFRYRTTIPGPLRLVLLVETEPPADRRWLINFLAELNVLLVWKSNDNARLLTAAEVPAYLSGVVVRT